MEKKVTVATSETLVGNKETAEHRTGSVRDTFTVLLSDWFLMSKVTFEPIYWKRKNRELCVLIILNPASVRFT